MARDQLKFSTEIIFTTSYFPRKTRMSVAELIMPLLKQSLGGRSIVEVHQMAYITISILKDLSIC